jgi:itaconate CoA-transferase
LRARGRWRQIGSPVGMLPALLPPGNWMDGEPRMDPVPALGEHNGTILAELGYVPAEIVAMRAAGIVQNAAVA